jgi:hypothetical protein
VRKIRSTDARSKGAAEPVSKGRRKLAVRVHSAVHRYDLRKAKARSQGPEAGQWLMPNMHERTPARTDGSNRCLCHLATAGS